MPSNIKSDNQYFGKYFERAVVEKINKTGILVNPNDYEDLLGNKFSNDEILMLNKEAEKVANYIGTQCKASYIGNHTYLGVGDIFLSDGTTIELKRVSNGSGTYHNTSIFFLVKYGFDFKTYMEKFNLYEIIEEYFPSVKVNRKNNSPVSQKDSSMIRHSGNQEGIKAIIDADIKLRRAFVIDLKEYFKEHPEDAFDLYYNMLNKVKIRTNKSSKPDRIIVYNYAKDTISEINPCLCHENIKETELGLIMRGLRIQFGWQNGVGLNNPTMRVFLD